MRFQAKRCVACGWPKATGMISFGNKLHEPHCDACCKSWQNIMVGSALASVSLALMEFRVWQAERAQKMGVPA